MAIFYPRLDLVNREIEKAGDFGEVAILKALESLNDSWKIFYNLSWRDKIDPLAKEREGEIDLIVFCQDLGVLVLEIKTGQVKYDGKEWAFEIPVRGVRNVMKMSPFEQARRNRHFLQNKLEKTAIGKDFLKDTAFTHTAWFLWSGPTGTRC